MRQISGWLTCQSTTKETKKCVTTARRARSHANPANRSLDTYKTLRSIEDSHIQAACPYARWVKPARLEKFLLKLVSVLLQLSIAPAHLHWAHRPRCAVRMDRDAAQPPRIAARPCRRPWRRCGVGWQNHWFCVKNVWP